MKNKGFCPTEIVFGNINFLEKLIMNYTNKRILLIISKALTKKLQLFDIINEIEDNENILWIDRKSGYTDQNQILDILNKSRGFQPSLIIAIGGGSTIDLGKAISILYYLELTYPVNANQINQILINEDYKEIHRVIPIVAIPTTAGTGAELTKWATIWDWDGKKKISIEDDSLYPIQAVIIPELCLNMPKSLTLSTALDAFCHACEAFWSRASTPLVRDIALKSIEIIMENLPYTLNCLNEIEYRQKLCRASVLAGMAFSQTRTTACHSISYPLTMNFGIEHGFAVIMTLPQIFMINKQSFEESDVLENLFEKYGGILHWLEKVTEGIVELRLSAFGIKESDINKLAQNSISKGRMDNNPVTLTIEQVEIILKRIW